MELEEEKHVRSLADMRILFNTCAIMPQPVLYLLSWGIRVVAVDRIDNARPIRNLLSKGMSRFGWTCAAEKTTFDRLDALAKLSDGLKNLAEDVLPIVYAYAGDPFLAFYLYDAGEDLRHLAGAIHAGTLRQEVQTLAHRMESTHRRSGRLGLMPLRRRLCSHRSGALNLLARQVFLD